MAIDGLIPIDQLPPTNNPALLHEFPAMKDGLTVRLNVGQVADLTAEPIIDGAPVSLNTLDKLAAAINDDPNFHTTMANALAARLRFDAAQVLNALEKGQAAANLGLSRRAAFQDKIINGRGQINQRPYTTIADDTYWCDRHYILTETAVVTPTIVLDAADGLPTMMRITQSQASAQRAGNAQIISAANSKLLRGKTVTLQSQLRSSIAQNIRFAILEWTGTADAVTSDVVNNWASTNYSGGNFFVGTNFIVRATGNIATPAGNVLTNFNLVTTLGSTLNNLVVVYFSESQMAQNVTLDAVWSFVEGDASLETVLPAPRSFSEELTLCQFHYQNIRCGFSAHAGGAGVSLFQTVTFNQMFAAPVISPTVLGTTSNVTGTIANTPTASSFRLGLTATAIGLALMDGYFYGLTAEL